MLRQSSVWIWQCEQCEDFLHGNDGKEDEAKKRDLDNDRQISVEEISFWLVADESSDTLYAVDSTADKRGLSFRSSDGLPVALNRPVVISDTVGTMSSGSSRLHWLVDYQGRSVKVFDSKIRRV